jgi:hypothetical protein
MYAMLRWAQLQIRAPRLLYVRSALGLGLLSFLLRLQWGIRVINYERLLRDSVVAWSASKSSPQSGKHSLTPMSVVRLICCQSLLLVRETKATSIEMGSELDSICFFFCLSHRGRGKVAKLSLVGSRATSIASSKRQNWLALHSHNVCQRDYPTLFTRRHFT